MRSQSDIEGKGRGEKGRERGRGINSWAKQAALPAVLDGEHGCGQETR